MISFSRFETLLNEDRIEYLKQQHVKGFDTSHDQFATHRSPADIIDHFAQHADPTTNKEYTQWIVGQYKKKNIRQEDAGSLRAQLAAFHNHKHKLATKDINKFKTRAELSDAISPYIEAPATRKEVKQQTIDKGRDLVASGITFVGSHPKNFEAYHLKSKDASIAIYSGGANSGKKFGTDWCTAADSKDNMFDHYTEDGDKLHTIHIEDDPYSPYQIHSSGQFMDRFDRAVDPHTFNLSHPAISKALAHIHPTFDITTQDPHVVPTHIEDHLRNMIEEPSLAGSLRHKGWFRRLPEHYIDRLGVSLISKAKHAEEIENGDPSTASKAHTGLATVLQHPNVSKNVVDQASRLASTSVAGLALAHPHTPIDVAVAKVWDHNKPVSTYSFSSKLFQRHDLRPEHVEHIVDHPDMHHLPFMTLELLGSNTTSRRHIEENPKLQEKLLKTGSHQFVDTVRHLTYPSEGGPSKLSHTAFHNALTHAWPFAFSMLDHIRQNRRWIYNTTPENDRRLRDLFDIIANHPNVDDTIKSDATKILKEL